MNRRDLFKFVGGVAAGAVVKATSEDKPTIRPIDMPNGMDEVTVDPGNREVLITDDDLVKAVESGDFAVHLPPPEEGRQLMIKNLSTYHSITVVSDGETWHVI